MTAAVDVSAMAEISAQISAVTARIAAITQAVQPSTTGTTASTSASATRFADTLAATATATATATNATATAPTASGSAAATAVATAESYLGTPYVWGGESRSGIDCSGLVQASYRAAGVDLPRVAADQANVGTPVASLAQAQPGDLLFFGDPAYHVAIYLGNNQLIESPEPGKTVHVTDVYQTPTSIRRVAASAPAASGAYAAVIDPAVQAYAPQFSAAETQYHLPQGLLAAVAQQESGGNPSAVSPAGARGLMQLMPSTAAGLGVDPDDPQQAIGAAARILAGNLARFGQSVPLALAAYNAGAGAVEQYGGIPPYAETQNYVQRITAMMAAGG